MSHNWQSLPLHMLRPLMIVRIPESDADTTGECINDALLRRIRKM